MAIKHVFIGIPVADYGQALAWYELLLGRPPDVIVKDDEAMWQVKETGWTYVVADAKRAGSALLAFLVDDLEEQVATITERGIATGAIETAPGLYRKAVITDPEDNQITIFENLGQGD